MTKDPLKQNGATPLLRVNQVSKRFGSHQAVDRLSLDIGAGEFFALLGPSGCGKTTLLRMLAGFESPDEGQIYLDGADIAPVPPHRRPVNMMFQNYALFPHLSVEDNIAFGLKRAGQSRDEIGARVADMVALGRLQGLEKRRPDQLSGGQRQRVALVRSLARRPRMLLLDEPLAALDRKLREETQAELMQVQRQLGMTFVIVTHDQDEAMILADRIGVMNQGRLVQVATPRELYEAPNSRWVAGFVGDINIIDGKVAAHEDGRVTLVSEAGQAILAAGAAAVGAQASIAIRPEKIRLAAGVGDAVDRPNHCAGDVIDIGYLGGTSVYRVRLDSGIVLRVAMANAQRLQAGALAPGQRVTASFALDDCVVLET